MKGSEKPRKKWLGSPVQLSCLKNVQLAIDHQPLQRVPNMPSSGKQVGGVWVYWVKVEVQVDTWLKGGTEPSWGGPLRRECLPNGGVSA